MAVSYTHLDVYKRQPYYTTKQHGTGLGLAIVQSVIADHNGTIGVENVESGGARFAIGLPLVEKAEA